MKIKSILVAAILVIASITAQAQSPTPSPTATPTPPLFAIPTNTDAGLNQGIVAHYIANQIAGTYTTVAGLLANGASFQTYSNPMIPNSQAQASMRVIPTPQGKTPVVAPADIATACGSVLMQKIAVMQKVGQTSDPAKLAAALAALQ